MMQSLRLPVILLFFVLQCLAGDIERYKFAELAAGNGGIVKLDNQLYDAITAQDRDWSVVIEYTAMGKEFRCDPCQEFSGSFKKVAKAWSSVSDTERSRHFFASLDFPDGQDVFRRLGFTSAPVIVFKRATSGPYAAGKNVAHEWSYDLNIKGFAALDLAEGISASTPVPIPFRNPPNYQLLFSAASVVVGVAMFATVFWKNFSAVLTSKITWSVISVATTLVFTSGHMYTRIRSTPFAVNTAQGPQYIAQTYSNQYGAETWLIATLYGSLSLCQLALIFFVPRTEKSTQRIAVYIWAGLTILLYSILMAVFRVKNQGYPFSILF